MFGRHRPWGLPTLPARAAITHGALPGRLATAVRGIADP